MAYENRFEQYDIYMERPAPLVPRHLRLPVTERMNSRGEPLIPLDDASVLALVPTLEKYGVKALAVGLLHAYANPAHEIRVAERSEEHTSELQSLMRISYAVFCLKKNKQT